MDKFPMPQSSVLHPIPLPLAPRLIPLFLLTALMVSCAVPVVPARVVYEDPTTFVRLEPDPLVQTESPETLHAHPASIQPEDVAGILRGMKVRDHRVNLYAKIAGEAPCPPATHFPS